MIILTVMWYTGEVHKPFYASGFLYHQPTHQILLQQFQQGDDLKHVLFGSVSHNGHDPLSVFQHCVETLLGVKINTSSIHPIYDYIHERLGEHFIFYIEVSDMTPKVYKSKNKTGWISLAKLGKCKMSEQTRHDIVIGERVIRARITPQT